ncbi:MAG: hypothetical protein K6A78_04930 [Prevotella sp.]|nr:hypothetical protein [Prevotella sp.]
MKTTKLFAFLMLGMTFMANVSSCSKGNENEDFGSGSGIVSNGAINDHQYVDLGLSVRWATCNWGASQSGPGMYNRGTSYTYTSSSKFDTYDVVTGEWGAPWRRPMKVEIQELVQKCTWRYDQYLGERGCAIVTGPNGNKIYIPRGNYHSRSRVGNDKATVLYVGTASEDVYSGSSEADWAREIIKMAKNLNTAKGEVALYVNIPIDRTVLEELLADAKTSEDGYYTTNNIWYPSDNGVINATGSQRYFLSNDEALVCWISSYDGSYLSASRYIRPVAPY